MSGKIHPSPDFKNPWKFFEEVLGWGAKNVAGSPSGPALPEDFHVRLPDHDTTLSPTWAIRELGAGDAHWQLLVRIEAPGIDPDGRSALEGWEATPHQRFERLLRETGIFAGLLITEKKEVKDGEDHHTPELRLIYAPSGETSGHLTFPLRALATVAGRPMLGGLKLLLDSVRLFTDADEHRLPALLRKSREAQAAVSTALAEQVLGALHELLRGFDAAEPTLIRDLARTRPGHLYEGLLTVLLRLVFILYAEDRDLLPSRQDGRAREIYETSYSARGLYARLVEDAATNPDTMDERRGAWGRLLSLFRLIHKGHPSHFVQARAGKLFNQDEFPFLEGRIDTVGPARISAISDGCILRILEGLMTLKVGTTRERVSYRALDVQQIGSVYETVMGFTVEIAAGRGLAIKAGKHNRTPVFVDLERLLAAKGKDRIKFLKEEADRSQLSPNVGKAVEAAQTVADLVAALDPIVDERGSPKKHEIASGTPIMQPTDERRRTGSHYTPRSLTEPIVRYALEPAFERLGPDATPEQILDLKVCDPAMGSGAFLVEACRALAVRLVGAWNVHKDKKPTIPPDEDEELHARRLVAQHCLYGVDRNPLATDLAKLSLWLATLARDHEFTFLDHALKSGDSLVGLTQAQIAAIHWDESKSPTFVGKLVSDHLREAEQGRKAIRDLAEFENEKALRDRLCGVEAKTEVARLIGDGIVGAFFTEEKARKRIEQLVTLQKEVQSHLGQATWSQAVEPYRAILKKGARPLTPFHWEIEFPEVFSRANRGFDAIVGNPPFAGKNTTIASNREGYLDWLKTLHQNAHGNADLVAHFFRRAFSLLRKSGCFGLIATNTIGQGDTRASGLGAIVREGGAISRAVKRLKWPGEAAVVVSVVHVTKGQLDTAILNGKPVSRISTYLVEGQMDNPPAALGANGAKGFSASFLLGMGFTFDDEAAAKGEAEPISTMEHLIRNDARNAERIKPYIGGEEINNSPTYAHHRYAIDFFDYPLRREEMSKTWSNMAERERRACRTRGIVPADYPHPVAADWPDLLAIVEARVKPARDKQNRKALRERWWQYAEKRPGLYRAILPLDRVIAMSRVSPHLAFCVTESARIYSIECNVFAFSDFAPFALLQSRIHETWARFLASTLEERLRYTPSDCFETFPLVPDFESLQVFEAAGRAYHDHRAALMVTHNEGMTKTYNRFHDPAETAGDIQRLRGLHATMDRAVLEAYGWHELASRAAPIFLDETNEDDHTYQGRLFWPSDFRDEVLARLLALNAERHAEEIRLGIAPGTKRKGEEGDEGESDDSDPD